MTAFGKACEWLENCDSQLVTWDLTAKAGELMGGWETVDTDKLLKQKP
jgi:hypothetical protein